MYIKINRYLPREVDPLVYNMSHEDPGSVSYSEIGGLSEQIRELREVRIHTQSSVKSVPSLTITTNQLYQQYSFS